MSRGWPTGAEHGTRALVGIGFAVDRFPTRLLVAALVVSCSGVAGADSLAAEPMAAPPVLADGTGLPEGQGTAVQGARLYKTHCAECHGPNAEGGSAWELVGDRATLASDYPDRGIGAFWPYAPPLFDYIRRAMPPNAPWSLTADDTYAIVAWLLERSDLVAADQGVDAAFLADLSMPNRQGFVEADR